MKKILCILFAVMLVVAMAIPAHAVTPGLEVPDIPEIPDIGDDLDFGIDFGGVVDDWFEENPVPPLTPIESAPDGSSWSEWFRGWFRWMPFGN